MLPPDEVGPFRRPVHERPTEPPTEALPTFPPPDPVADDLVDDEWTEPQRRSRTTMVLVVAVLVALGFLAGVLVGRAGSAFTPSGGGTAATSSARPAPSG